MGLLGGIILLVIGLGLVLVAIPRANGTRLLPISGGMEMLYPALCLMFLAYGAAFIIMG